MRVPESWQNLVAHSARLSDTSLRSLLAADPARATDFALRAGPLYASFARQRSDRDALAALLALADAARARLEGSGFAVDYAEVRRADLTRPKDPGEAGLLALVAARPGRTRLIDNLPFDED